MRQAEGALLGGLADLYDLCATIRAGTLSSGPTVLKSHGPRIFNLAFLATL